MRVAGPWRPDRSRSPRHRRGGSAGSTRRATEGHGRTPSRQPGTRSPHLPDRASLRPAARTAARARARGANRGPATPARQGRSTRDCVRRSCACPHRPSTDVGASGSILEPPSLVPPGPYGRGTPMAEHPLRRIVLAYSGGLDTSVILRWLIERYQAEVVAFCADLGQGEELGGLDEKARRTGATKLVVEDLREEFVRDYVFPMLRAGAIYENQYLLGTSIARPLIAKRQVEVARREGADAVAHGATGKGNDQVRFELAYAALAPELTVIAPWREWDMKGRADLIAYAERHRIPITTTAEKPYSSDRNLLHVSYEGGLLEDPWRAPYEDMFQLTVAPERAAERAEEIEVELEAGGARAGERGGARAGAPPPPPASPPPPPPGPPRAAGRA